MNQHIRRNFSTGEVVGWLALQSMSIGKRKPGSCGERWSATCKCGRRHDVSHESLVSGRVRACRRCAKAFRAEEDRGLG